MRSFCEHDDCSKWKRCSPVQFSTSRVRMSSSCSRMVGLRRRVDGSRDQPPGQSDFRRGLTSFARRQSIGRGRSWSSLIWLRSEANAVLHRGASMSPATDVERGQDLDHDGGVYRPRKKKNHRRMSKGMGTPMYQRTAPVSMGEILQAYELRAPTPRSGRTHARYDEVRRPYARASSPASHAPFSGTRFTTWAPTSWPG